MLARPLHSRDDLLARLQCPSTACERALRDDIVTLLGSFAAPGELPFYLVRIQSARGNQWHVGLKIDDEQVRYVPFWLDKADIPWQHWDGYRHGTNPIRDGDIPEWCHHRRSCARTKP